MSNKIVSLLLAVLAIGLIACSSDDAPPGGGGGAGGTAGSAGSGGSGQGSCDSAKLIGVWGGANYSMEIAADMSYRASGTPNMASINVTGTVQVDQCNIKLTDISGKYACPASQIGEYTFTVTGTTLAFALIADPCDGRRIPLTAGALTKK